MKKKNPRKHVRRKEGKLERRTSKKAKTWDRKTTRLERLQPAQQPTKSQPVVKETLRQATISASSTISTRPCESRSQTHPPPLSAWS
jgi:hypothetical protein